MLQISQPTRDAHKAFIANLFAIYMVDVLQITGNPRSRLEGLLIADQTQGAKVEVPQIRGCSRLNARRPSMRRMQPSTLMCSKFWQLALKA